MEKGIVLFLLVVTVALASPACAKSKSEPEHRIIVETEVRGTIVSTRDGAKFYGDDAAIDVYNYGTPGFQDSIVLVFLASNGSDLWTAQTQVTRDILPLGSGTAEIKQAPLEIGVANVERKRGDYPISRPSSGTFTYSLGDEQRVNVAIDSDSELVAGTVAARFQVRCWVNRREIPRSDGQSAGETTGGGELVLDEQFSTPQCAEFVSYGP